MLIGHFNLNKAASKVPLRFHHLAECHLRVWLSTRASFRSNHITYLIKLPLTQNTLTLTTRFDDLTRPQPERTNRTSTSERTTPVSSRLVSPFVRSGSALRSAPRPAPFLAPPSFETLPEKPRRGAFLLPGCVTRASANRERTRHPLPLSHSVRRGKEDLGGRYLSGSFGREF